MPKDTWGPCDGITVTVPNDGQPHQLLALLAAVQPNVAPRCRFLTLQNDPAQSGASDLLLGSAPTDSQGSANPAKLTSTNYGYRLQKTAPPKVYTGFRDEDFNIARIWVMAATAAVQLNVEIVRG